MVFSRTHGSVPPLGTEYIICQNFRTFFFSDVYCANPNEEDNEEDLLITFMIDD